MKLIDKNESRFGVRAGKTTDVESVYAVALYDTKDGSIRHMHQVISMADSLPYKPETIEKAAISNAKRFGHNVDKLKVLHIENLKDATSQYRVDIKTEKLVKLHRMSLSDVLKINANKIN